MSINSRKDDLRGEGGEPLSLSQRVSELMRDACLEMVGLNERYRVASEQDKAAFELVKRQLIQGHNARQILNIGTARLIEMAVDGPGEQDVNDASMHLQFSARVLRFELAWTQNYWRKTIRELLEGRRIDARTYGENRIVMSHGDGRVFSGSGYPTEVNGEPFLDFDPDRAMLWIGEPTNAVQYGVPLFYVDGEPAASINVTTTDRRL